MAYEHSSWVSGYSSDQWPAWCNFCQMYKKLVVVGHFSEQMSRDKSEGEITGTDKKLEPFHIYP